MYIASTMTMLTINHPRVVLLLSHGFWAANIAIFA